MYANRCYNFKTQICDKERCREDSDVLRPYNRHTVHVECKNKGDTSNDRGNWKHFIIIQEIPEQHTGKAGNQGATGNGHVGHCAHTSESTSVKVQNIQHGK
jgi:hypothetical protein